MGVRLLGANDARISLGDLAAIAGKTALTCSGAIYPLALGNTRLVSQWSGTASAQAFVCQVTAAGLPLMAVNDGDGGSSFLVTANAGQTIRVGSWNWFAYSWLTGTPNTIQLWLNGALLTGTTGSSADAASLGNSTSAVQIGHETAETADGLDAIYAEFACWGARLSAADLKAASLGAPPPTLNAGANRIFYLSLLSATDLVDQWGGVTATNTAGTSDMHPYVDEEGVNLLMNRRRNRTPSAR